MKKLYLTALGYLYLPMLLFILGWTAVWVQIPVMAVSILALYWTYEKLTIDEKEGLLFSKAGVVAIVVVFFLFCIFCGQGDLFWQDFDWKKHHAILYDLVNYDWPVVYRDDVMLTYYLGQYIVPGFVGKLLGNSKTVAVWMVAVWNTLGLTLVYLLTCQYLQVKGKWKKAGVFFIMIFWSGATNLGSEIYQLIGNEATLCSYKWIDLNRIIVHFASNLDAMRGAFQHVIVPWLGSILFLKQKKNYSIYVLLALPMLFSATFGFLYFVLFLLGYFVWNLMIEKRPKEMFGEAFSKENLCILPLAVVILIYLVGNVLGEKPYGLGWDLLNMFTRLDFFLIFIVVEFLGYMLFLWKDNQKNIIFYIIFAELMLIPFISLGMFNDLCSRGSIPARFFLMVLCMEQFFKYGWKNWRNFGLAVIFLIGTMNGLQESYDTVQYTLEEGIGSEELLMDGIDSYDGWAANPKKRADDAYNYYTMNYSESLFYKIARK